MIPSPSSSVNMQIIGGKIYLRLHIRLTLMGNVNTLLNTKSVLIMPSNVLLLCLEQTFPPKIWIFTEGEDDEIESRLPFKIFFTLKKLRKESLKVIFFRYFLSATSMLKVSFIFKPTRICRKWGLKHDWNFFFIT